jgi:uncharacterized protein YhfF
VNTGPPGIVPGMIEEFWQQYMQATGVDGPYTAWAFGTESEPELATELALLVRDGPKRATTGLLAEYEAAAEPLPQVGDLSVILDGAGVPVCVIRTSRVETRRFGDVDEAFAWDEGEGDRSLAWWRDTHLRLWARSGETVDDDTRLVLEWFDLVYPVAG